MAVSAKPPERAHDQASEENERSFRTLSGEPVRELYTPEDLPAGIGGAEDPIGLPVADGPQDDGLGLERTRHVAGI